MLKRTLSFELCCNPGLGPTHDQFIAPNELEKASSAISVSSTINSVPWLRLLCALAAYHAFPLSFYAAADVLFISQRLCCIYMCIRLKHIVRIYCSLASLIRTIILHSATTVKCDTVPGPPMSRECKNKLYIGAVEVR